MPLFHVDAPIHEHSSTHRALKKIGEWFAPGSLTEGGNYVVTRNDSNYLNGYSILINDALAFIAPTGRLGTIGSARETVPESRQGYALLGETVTAQFSLNLDTAQVALTWTVTGQPQQNATFALVLYRDDPALNSIAFYAESSSDNASYSLNIQLL
jgi:hypothetical protein